MLCFKNAYVKKFKMSVEKLTSPDLKVVIKEDAPVGEHVRRFNAPVVNDIAVIIASDENCCEQS